MLRIEDTDRVRILTLDRPEVLNAFDPALFEAVGRALADAAEDSGVAVVVITGTGRAFTAGADMRVAAAHNDDRFEDRALGFPVLAERLRTFPKPLLCAVNGLAVGLGATMLPFADLVFMSSAARVRCPFTRLAVAPEAASSVTFPRLMGRQNASWVLLSSEWIDAAECERMGLAFRVCAPEELMDETMRHARVLASKPISSLVETKRTIVAPFDEEILAALDREMAAFSRLLGAPANREAIAAFAERREPDFSRIDELD